MPLSLIFFYLQVGLIDSFVPSYDLDFLELEEHSEDLLGAVKDLYVSSAQLVFRLQGYLYSAGVILSSFLAKPLLQTLKWVFLLKLYVT